jgi:hypothetical protein
LLRETPKLDRIEWERWAEETRSIVLRDRASLVAFTGFLRSGSGNEWKVAISLSDSIVLYAPRDILHAVASAAIDSERSRQERRHAIDALGRMPSTGVKPDALLHAMLNHADEEIAVAGARLHVLAKAGDETVSERLLEIARAGSPGGRQEALRLLGRAGVASARVLDVMERALGDDDPETQRAAVEGLAVLPRTRPATLRLVARLGAALRSHVVRHYAREVLLKQPREAAPELKAILYSHDSDARTWVLRVLNDMGRVAAPVAMQVPTDAHVPLRVEAALARWIIGGDGGEILAILPSLLVTRERDAVIRVLDVATRFGGGSSGATEVASLVATFDDEVVRSRAAQMLVSLGTCGRDLLQCWSRANATGRRAIAAEGLGRMLAEFPGVSDDFRRLTLDQESAVRRAAARGIGQSRLPREVVDPWLIGQLRQRWSTDVDTPNTYNEEILEILGQLVEGGALEDSLLRDVLVFVGSRSPGVRARSVEVLGKRGKPGSWVEAELWKLLADRDPLVVVHAYLGLRRMRRGWVWFRDPTTK